MRAWFDISDGAATSATIDLALADVVLRPTPASASAPAPAPAPAVESLAFAVASGRVTAHRDRDGGGIEARQLRLRTADGVDWPGGALALAWRQRDAQPVTGGSFSADRLDIGLLARMASRLPIGDESRRLLGDWRPEGVAEAVEGHWDGPGEAPLHYALKARVSSLSLASRPSARPGGIGRPGVRNAAVQFDASDAGGSARIALSAGAIELPGVFDEPLLPLDHLSGNLVWKVAKARPGKAPGLAPGLSVEFQDVRFANSDAHGRFSGRWRNVGDQLLDAPNPARAPAASNQAKAIAPKPDLGWLELDGELADGRAERVYRYLPLALPVTVRDYLRQAVQRGRVTSAGVHIRGELRDFPFFKHGGTILPAASWPSAYQSDSVRTPPSARRAGTVDRPPEFRITAKAEDLDFVYVPGRSGAPSAWPMLTGAAVELALDRGTFFVRNGRGRTGDLQWDKIDGAIEHLGGEEAVLRLDAAARAPLAEMLRVVESSPVGGWLDRALDETTATGRADLAIALGLPLRHIDTGATLTGSVALAGDNDLRMSTGSPLLHRARGRVDFSRTGFTLAGVGAEVYGGQASIEGGTDSATGRIGFAAHGQVSADGLRRAVELGPVARFATALSGETAYRLNLAFVHGRPELTVGSDLVGMAIDLPAPLAKSAVQPLAMRYRTRVEAGAGSGSGSGGSSSSSSSSSSGSGSARESLEFELGARLRAHYLRETTGDSPRVLRGGIGVFAAAPEPASGVAATARLASVDVDAWRGAYGRMFPVAAESAGPMALSGASAAVAARPSTSTAAGTATATAGATATATATAAGSADAAMGYQPDSITLHVDDLQAAGRHLTHVEAGLSQGRVDAVWRADVHADQVVGHVEYRPPGVSGAGAGAAGGTGRVYARLSRLVLPKGDANPLPTKLDASAAESPALLPALDLAVEDLELGGLHLGRVEVQASNRPLGGTAPRQQGRDWQLTKLAVTTPEAQLVATGHWSAAPGSSSPSLAAAGTPTPPRRMVLDFRLQIADSGALLDRLGTRNVIRGGKGELSGEVAWLGSPLALDYPSLSGQLRLQVDQGQFLKADPGAARLLGVLSLQSLPRRLALDFRDVFDQGFAFDAITGDLTIARGVARTSNLRMRGVQAAVAMEGSADIEQETEDLRVVVVPKINAGTAALAYAVINPLVGLGAFVAQALLEKPLAAAGTREFHIVGPWSDPKVLSVSRKSEDLAPAPALIPTPVSGPSVAPSWAPTDPAASGPPQNAESTAARPDASEETR